jgi:outer membrane protein assembly factor BamA
LCISGLCLSQPIIFQGNRHLSNPYQIINPLPVTALNDSILNNWHDLLNNQYTRLGYFWAQIQIETLKSQIRIKIQENEPAKIKQITLLNNQDFTAAELNAVIARPVYFSDAVLQTQINKLTDFYANHGYPLISIRAQDFALHDSEKSISYTLAVRESTKVFINDIYFTNTTVKNNRLKQIYRFKYNQVYAKTEIEQKLSNLADYQTIFTDYALVRIDTSYILQVALAKMKSSQITGALTYLAQDNTFNGYFYFTNHNFLNSLRKVSFAFEKYAQFTDFSLAYVDPFLFNFIFSTGLKHSTYDTVYSQTDFNLELKLPFARSFSTNFSINYIHLASGIADLNSNTTWWLGQGLQLQSLTVLNNIPQGYLISILPRVGSRNQDSRFYYLSYFDITGQYRQPVLSTFGYGLDIISKNIYCKDELTMADSLRLGGIKNLRGYNENQFSTDRYLLFKNEFRYYLPNATLLFFDDFALINLPRRNKIKNGYGIGLRIKSKIGTVGIDYGLSQITNPLQGKIHLTFQNQF